MTWFGWRVSWIDLILTLFYLGLAVVLLIRERTRTWGLFALFALLIPIASGTLIGMPRFGAVIFAFYVLLGGLVGSLVQAGDCLRRVGGAGAAVRRALRHVALDCLTGSTECLVPRTSFTASSMVEMGLLLTLVLSTRYSVLLLKLRTIPHEAAARAANLAGVMHHLVAAGGADGREAVIGQR